MRKLTIAVAVLAIIYAGYWFIGAAAAERSAKNVLAGMEAEGWQVSYADISTTGFPSRFDTSATDLDIVAPDGQFGWSAPFMQVLALSYQPNQIIVAFPPSQIVQLGRQNLTIASDTLRASAAFNGELALPLETATAQTGPAAITSDAGWSIGIDSALAALQPAGPIANRYKLYVEADALLLPDDLRAFLDPRGIHPPKLTRITFDTNVVLDRPLDRHSFASWDLDPPRPLQIGLSNMAVAWGAMNLTGAGTLDIGADGFPDGELRLSLASWRDMIGMLVSAGMVQSGQSILLESAAQSMSQGRETLDIPISFRNRQMFIGPFPIGPAPRFY